jgi:ribosomal protein S12 methylthiotransferase accessory factor
VFSAGYLVAPARGDGSFDRACAGKGSTVEQARMSALAEAIERFSGVYRGDEAVVHATAAELGDDAIPPARLQLFSPAQEAAGGPAPPPLDRDTRIAWAPAWSLAEGRRRHVPLAYCYAEAPLDSGAIFCRPSSNGSAAGNCLEEAILQGLFEAVERDAVAVWWYGRVRRPEALVPPSTSALFDAQRAAHEALGWTLAALDLTHDIGLPVIAAVATHPPSDRLAMGFGCHSDPGLALRRALSELNQVFDPRASVVSPWDGMAASKLDLLRPDPGAPPVAPAAAIASRDLKVHVETWVHRLSELGLDTVVVDKTRPDLGLAVAQVIVPGLRHVWPRFAPGRLYTVPLALGWTTRQLTEDELNPQHLLI